MQTAFAAGGDFSIDFAAAAPFTYDHLTGGGAFNDGTIGKSNDVVESLEGGDFTCSDTVTYLTQIRHTGPATDDPQTLELQFSFLANTTGQPGAAHSDVTFVGVNYGSVQNGAGAGGTDSGIIDDGGSTASIVNEYFVPSGTTPFNGADELILVVQVDDLESGEEVILRIDVALTCDPGSDPTGNLQAQFNSGRVVAINDDTPADDNLTGGEQTIPFKQIGDLTGAGEPLLRIEKTVTTADGVCPGGETLTVTAGDTVKYCYSVSNPGTADLFDVEVIDDNGTPGNTSDDLTVTLSGLADLDGDADLGDLASGSTATGEALVTLNVGGTVVNTATATGNYGLSGGNYQVLTDTDTARVTIEAQQIFPPDITLTKTADPASINEPGGDVTFTIVVVNHSSTDATLDSLNDIVYGDLNGMGDCSVPQPLAADGGSYSCSFTAYISGNPGDVHTNLAEAVASNAAGSDTASDDATVTINDVPSAIEILKSASPESVDEPGDNVTFSFTINNLSAVDAVTINSLSDTVYGDLNGLGDCSVPQTIPVGGSYSCSFEAFVDATETNIVTASGVDDDGNPVSASDDAMVTLNDVPSAIEIIKTASPTSVDEPGADVTFSFAINNLSAVDAVTLDSLTDTVYGDLNGQGDCSVPQTIAAGGSYTCSLTAFVSGNAGDVHTNVAMASGLDDDGQPVSDDDDASVSINDVPSAIEVIKSASPESVDEPGGDVTFSFVVNNLSAVDAVTINSLTDSIYGDLNGQGDCSVPQTIPAGGSYSCSLTAFVSGNVGNTHTNVATASGTDDDGNPVSDDDDTTVTINDVPASILTTKSASPTSVPETGGNVTFTIIVENTSVVDTVTLNSVVDSIFGDVSASCAPALPADLLPGESVTCSFNEFVSGDYPGNHTNVATASGIDDDGNPVSDDDQEEVPFEDILPDISITKTADPTSVPESGADVTFTFVATNNSPEAATLDSLVDNIFGDLNGQGDCAVPQTLAANGGSYSCSITVFLAADDLAPHTNVVTATASDDDGNSDKATDDETVSFTDVAPEIRLTKSASPSSVPETGGDVTFTFLVENIGQEDVSLTALTDTVFGDLNGQGTCTLPQDILIGGSYSCAITVNLLADNLADHYDLATAIAVDDDNTRTQDSDEETVTFEDVLPDISLVKTADPTSVSKPGKDVTFTFVVTNNSLGAATLDSLVDSDFGDLNGQGDCSVPQPLAGNGGSYTCSVTVFIAGNAGDTHLNVVTATASDNDGNSDTASDDATVSIEDVAPIISIVKDGPASINEGGDTATYDITITNNSVSTDPLTITSLVDDKFGDLLAEAETARGGTIVLTPGESFTFQITRSLEFNVGDLHNNVVTVIAIDDEGTQATDNDDHTVAFEDVAPAITVTKTADQAQVFAPGEDVTFTIVIENNSVSTDPVTINSLTDSIYGDLNGLGTCSVPQTIAAGDSYTCAFTVLVDGDETDVVIASGADDEGTPVSASDDAFVEMINPSLDIEKSTNGFDADVAPGPEILDGASVTWEYLVTNDGDVDLTNITVYDDVLGNVCTIDFLAAGASTSCTMTGTAVDDQYANKGSASVNYTDADGDAATRSDSDDSHYFGALPSLSIDKTTADAFGNEGDALGILPGETVTWNYLVTNTGNVALENVSVTDDQGVTVTCPQSTLAVGESMTCTATGIAGEGWYNNTGTASGDYSDDVGNSTTVSDSDSSSYFGLTPGAVTNSQLCDYGDQFRLIFTPDMGRYSASTPYYKLSDSNPGQTFYNVFYINDGSTDTITMEIPYPYVTQGANPVHVYGGLFVNESGGYTCFDPADELAAYGSTFGLGDYTDTNDDGVTGFGDVYLVEVPAELGLQYINIHLDYGLEKTDGWLKKGTNATSDGTGKNPAPADLSINDHIAHTFNAYAEGVLISGSTDMVYNLNEFKQIRGFGGLVQEEVNLDPVVGAQVELLGPDGNIIETMTSDADGWYLSNYVHKGKAADYTLRLVSTGEEIVVNVGGKVKFGEGNFLVP